MIALADNRAAFEPHKVLTRRQQAAIRAIAFYRSNRKRAGGWEIGTERFSQSLIETLARHRLVRETKQPRGAYLALTQGGTIAAERLQVHPQ